MLCFDSSNAVSTKNANGMLVDLSLDVLMGLVINEGEEVRWWLLMCWWLSVSCCRSISSGGNIILSIEVKGDWALAYRAGILGCIRDSICRRQVDGLHVIGIINFAPCACL